MLLQIKVAAGREWYERVYPDFIKNGFKEREDLAWADPESDGELIGVYFEFVGSGDAKSSRIPIEKFNDFINNIKNLIIDGESPFIEISIVPDR